MRLSGLDLDPYSVVKTTNALTTSPREESGEDTTADSATAGCILSVDSTSKGPTKMGVST